MRERETFFTAVTFVCCGFGRGRRAYLLSTAGLGRRVCCLLCSSTGLRVCCSKPLARRSRIVANSNPRMQREYTARIQSTQLALVGETAALLPSCAAASALWPRSPDASQQISTHQRIVQDTYRRRTEKRARPCLIWRRPSRRAGPSRNQTNDPQHYALSPVTRSNRRGVVASTPRAARCLPSRGSAH